ncbi:MAG: hypothetical protein ACJ71W_17470 [Terriglobales bacterium]
MSVAVNQELADRAMQIARAQRIDFGEALCQARREMADIAEIVQQKQKSTTPDPSKVREAVDGGLRAVGWKTGSTGGMDAYSIFLGVFEVGFRLSELGLGPNIVSSLKMELSNFLNYAFQNGRPSDVIPQASDHMTAIYKQALANKIETQVWSDGIVRPVQGVALAERAEKLSRQRNISFGEALNLARSGVELADDVIDPQRLDDALRPLLKSIFMTIFGGAQQKIIDAMDVLKFQEQVKKALSDLGVGAAASTVTKAVENSLDAVSGVVQLNAIDGIIGKAVAAAQQAYKQALS